MEQTKIEWCSTTKGDVTYPGYTFNPWIGCHKVNTGCMHCYAEDLMAKKPRWSNCWGPEALTQRLKTSDENWKKPLRWNREAQKLDVRLKVFCASLADVFEDNRDVVDWRKELFDLIDKTPHLDWLLLTKRPENVKKFLPFDGSVFWNNVWLGTSVSNQEDAHKNLPALLDIPARVRFVSAEPLLGEIDFLCNSESVFGEPDWNGEILWLEEIDWIIAGGESGPKYRTMEMDHLTAIYDQCQMLDVPFFVKQDSGRFPGRQGRIPDTIWETKQMPESVYYV